MLPGADQGLLHQVLGALPVAVAEPQQQREERPAVLALQCGELVLGGRPVRCVREGDSGRHGRMAPQWTVRGQGVRTGVRRTVDRVDERFDERSACGGCVVRAPRSRTPDGLMGVSEPRVANRASLPVCK